MTKEKSFARDNVYFHFSQMFPLARISASWRELPHYINLLISYECCRRFYPGFRKAAVKVSDEYILKDVFYSHCMLILLYFLFLVIKFSREDTLRL